MKVGKRDKIALGVLTTFLVIGVFGRPLWEPIALRLIGQNTVGSVVADIEGQVEARLVPQFQVSGLAYPPEEIAFLVFKEEKTVELWARGEDAWHHVKDCAVQGASGGPGPKLQEGDLQVPEGIY